MSELLAGLPELGRTAHETDIESLQMLWVLLHYERPARIVEAGTYQGHFSVAAARLLPDSHVLTFDVTQHFELPHLPNLEIVRGDFGEGCPEGFDFAFVDSGPVPFRAPDHDLRYRHWRIAQERALPGALLVCHDTNDTRWSGGPAIAAECLCLTGGRGLGLWRKPW